MKENLRDCLKELLLINDTKNEIAVKEGDSQRYKATVKDIQELNNQSLYCLADLLGMSDLYLEKEK